MLTRILIIATALAAAATVPAAAAVLSDEPVRATPANELKASADGDQGYLAWSQNSAAHPNHYDAYVSLHGATPVKVNLAGTSGWNGGIDGNRLIYQQVRYGQSDLRIFDLTGHTRTTPANVNTLLWEWRPTISGDWILFGRENFRATPSQEWVVLHNVATGQSITLAHTTNGSSAPGQVNGDFATYMTCGTAACNVFRYQISSGLIVKMPNPRLRIQYAPSVSSNGTVYYASSGPACGQDVHLLRFTPGSSSVASLLARFPSGADLDSSYVDDRANGDRFLFHDRGACSRNNQSIYRFIDPT
jgi:hypothetical protein